MPAERSRLVTRSDFDGLVCALLLRELDLIDEITFVHPKDVQDGVVALTGRDIMTNLPYDPRARLVFDHHHSETLRQAEPAPNHVLDPYAPSAARVVYDHYGAAAAFPRVSPELMDAVDRADSADYDIDDVLTPGGWTLLNFLMDSRTGLGRFRDFRVSNYDLMMGLVEECRLRPIEEILTLPDVAERVELYHDQSRLFRAQLRECTRMDGDLAVVDLRRADVIHAGNRFLVYALFPHATISAHVMWGRQQRNTVVAVGKSIFDRSCALDVGALMLTYGGGGHRNAGTCQVAHRDADRVVEQIAGHVAAVAHIRASR